MVLLSSLKVSSKDFHGWKLKGNIYKILFVNVHLLRFLNIFLVIFVFNI